VLLTACAVLVLIIDLTIILRQHHIQQQRRFSKLQHQQQQGVIHHGLESQDMRHKHIKMDSNYVPQQQQHPALQVARWRHDTVRQPSVRVEDADALVNKLSAASASVDANQASFAFAADAPKRAAVETAINKAKTQHFSSDANHAEDLAKLYLRPVAGHRPITAQEWSTSFIEAVSATKEAQREHLKEDSKLGEAAKDKASNGLTSTSSAPAVSPIGHGTGPLAAMQATALVEGVATAAASLTVPSTMTTVTATNSMASDTTHNNTTSPQTSAATAGAVPAGVGSPLFAFIGVFVSSLLFSVY
jgi:hypothetical protein